MNKNLFSYFESAIRSLDFNEITNATQIPKSFLLDTDGELSSHYIPFDHVNTSAKIVLVGITPGFTQWKNAMKEAQIQLLGGATLESAHAAAKKVGAFSGTMRPNLIALLDSIGVQNWLKIDSCEKLFTKNSDLLQSTSILSHPIFVKGENYNGAPNMVRTIFLQKQIIEYFAKEAEQLKNALYVPLGPKVSEGLAWLVNQGVLNETQILDGLPHPSGANAERIAYFLGRKNKKDLSIKTNAEKLDEVRLTITKRVQLLSKSGAE